MQRINIMVGRFQPLTKGHLKCIEYSYNRKKVSTIICMINTADDKVDEKKPFPSSILLPIYKNLAKNNDVIEDIILVQSADIVKIGEILKGLGYEICSWVCGNDRYNAYSRMSTKYHDDAYLSEDFEMINVERDDDISATLVRDCIIKNDLKGFSDLTVFDESIFDILKTFLNK
jgi:nicotinic acid mononucleotide adenylyltransferase